MAEACILLGVILVFICDPANIYYAKNYLIEYKELVLRVENSAATAQGEKSDSLHAVWLEPCYLMQPLVHDVSCIYMN